MRSKPKIAGYRRKLAGLQARFAEGLRLQLVRGGGRAFIEYIAGEHAWRAVHVESYLFVHCLWVVGQSEGRGLGRLLLERCLEDARTAGMAGVAMTTSHGPWLIGRGFPERHGFELADRAPGWFDLLVRRFGGALAPRFPDDWETRLSRSGPRLVVFRTDQRPFVEAASAIVQKVADRYRLAFRAVALESTEDVRWRAPSAYRVFNLVCDGRLLECHPLNEGEFIWRLEKLVQRRKRNAPLVCHART